MRMLPTYGPVMKEASGEKKRNSSTGSERKATDEGEEGRGKEKEAGRTGRSGGRVICEACSRRTDPAE